MIQLKKIIPESTRLTDDEFDDTLTLAIIVNGIDHQTQILFEEMAELQNALCKLRRGRASADNVCEEIADVLIMCLQMAEFYGSRAVSDWMENKMIRLRQRLKNPDRYDTDL